jgi:hypothetical protein
MNMNVKNAKSQRGRRAFEVSLFLSIMSVTRTMMGRRFSIAVVFLVPNEGSVSTSRGILSLL